MKKNNLEYYFQKQRYKIIKQLEFAKKHVPFYKEYFGNFDLRKIKNYGDFVKYVPVLESAELINNPKMFCSDERIVYTRQSSSTLGIPKQIFLTENDLEHWSKNGRLTMTPYFKKGMTVAHSLRKEKYYLSGLDKSVLEYSEGRKVMTFNPRDEAEILKCVRQSDVIIDYAEMIYYISDIISRAKATINKTLVLSYVGNKLEDDDVVHIRNNFSKVGVKAKIYSEYSTTETGPIGCSNSKKQNKFEIIYNNLNFIEVVDPLSCNPSREGEIVITSLGRTGSVFIRYKIGDLGLLDIDKDKIFFNLKKRKAGVKVASVFFSPEHVFRIIRRLLKVPLFCEINIFQVDYFNKIDINIFTEKRSGDKFDLVFNKLAEELDIVDDIGSTISLNISMKRKKFNSKEIRKGFKFNFKKEEKEISMTDIMKEIRKDMKGVSNDLNKSDIYFEETRDKNNNSSVMPLIALRSNPCSWLKNCGGCVTCGYQLASSLGKKPTRQNLINQTKYAIKKVPSAIYPLITFNGAGSLLDSSEVSGDLLPVLLKMLKEAGYKEFNFESRPEFLLNEKKLKLLRENFDTVSVGIGLESVNDIVRNEFIHKGTQLETYLKAIGNLKKYHIDGDVYVQLGKPFLTIKEDIDDAVKTAEFAFEKGFTRVFLMLCNIQPFTLTHYLWKQGRFNPPMLWSAVEVLRRLPKKYRANAYVKGFNRAVPTPLEFAQNCPKCNTQVVDKLIHWNLTGDFGHIENMPKCNCYDEFAKKMSVKQDKNLENRIRKLKLEIFRSIK